MNLVQMMLRVLLELLDCYNQKLTFAKDVPGLVNNIALLFSRISPQQATALGGLVAKNLADIQHHIDHLTGKLRPDIIQSANVDTTARSTYPRLVTLPGGRYDNDKISICDIDLLPKEDEIRSKVLEFLPSTDFRHQHFLPDTVSRHLDTHFRLFRHESFGELKAELHGLIQSVEKEQRILCANQLRLGNIQINAYPNARVFNTLYHKSKGLQAIVQFRQLAVIRGSDEKKRRAWWIEDPRLAFGSMLCLVSHNGQKCSVVFLEVTARETNPEKWPSLSEDENWAYITATMIAPTDSTVSTLLELSLSHTNEIMMLEFSSIMLDAFLPILQNLQTMQKDHLLPFKKWILPGTVDEVANVPPPIYARNHNFNFPLEALLKNFAGELNLSSNSSPDDHALVRVSRIRQIWITANVKGL